MKPGWLIGIVMAFVILAVVFGIANNAYMGEEATSTLDVLMRPLMQTSLWGTVKVAVGSLFTTDFWDALWTVLWWNYPAIFHDNWLIARYVFFIPLSIGFLFSIGLAIFRGVSSS